MKYAAVTLALAFGVPIPGVAVAQTENTLATFTGTNGNGPWTGLVADRRGRLYGATMSGGANNNGVAYRLTKTAKGKWRESVLYSFSGGGGNGDGAYPQMPLLAIDRHGALYGTTPNGGAHAAGTVFKLTRGAGQWNEQILYSFTGGNDGSQPIGGVTLDSKGNIYGTTNIGGGSQNCGGGCGVVFELTPGQNGSWAETVLHAFTGYVGGHGCGNYDGANPYRTMIAIDHAGNLFGTTNAGGNSCNAAGTVWELSPAGGGTWTETILDVTDGPNGDTYPDAGGVLDGQGNFYFAVGGGNILELVKNQGYQERLLYQYPGPGAEDDYDTVQFDRSGNLYWTSHGGGGNGYSGTVEKLAPDGQGGWTHSTLYAFANSKPQGNGPIAGVTIDASGNVFGTCSVGGGAQGNEGGTAFEITP